MTDASISHYRGLEKIGGGGMGVVSKAEDIVLGGDHRRLTQRETNGPLWGRAGPFRFGRVTGNPEANPRELPGGVKHEQVTEIPVFQALRYAGQLPIDAIPGIAGIISHT